MTARRLIVALVAIASLLATPVVAAGDDMRAGAQKFVKSVSDQALGVLQEKLNKEERDARLGRVFDQSFDIAAIGAFCLGRYWGKTSPEERQRYLALFRDYVVQTYSARLDEVYDGEKVELDKVRPDGGDGAIVGSKIVSGDSAKEPVRIDWKVRWANGDYKIVDVLVGGVSMALTQRDEFVSVVQRSGGVPTLLDSLEKKIAKLKSGSS